MELTRKTINLVQLLSWVTLLSAGIIIPSQFLGWNLAILRGTLNVGTLCIVYYLHIYFLSKLLSKEKIWKYLGTLFSLLFGGILIRNTINTYLTKRYELMDALADQRIELAVTTLGIMTVLMVSAIVYLLSHKIDKEKEILAEINELQSAQLQYLKYQMNPHFLFNSLNNIYGLALKRSERTANTILELSDLIKYSLYETSEKVSLKKELDQLEKSISLHSLKSTKPANIKILVEGDVSDYFIPSMILIPLVENAFKHGDLFIHDEGYIKIRIEVQEHKMTFSCENSFDSRMEKDEVGGIGLANIRKRLEIIYEDKFDLNIEEGVDRYRVKLQLEGSC